MALIIQKFGGSSVGTPERIRKVAERIACSYKDGHQLVIVVSAMGHTTDELIDLAHRVSLTPPHREMDMLLTTGERISMALLSMALADLKVPAFSLTGSQSGIITDESHRRARIRRILGNRVRATLERNAVAIVAGFQGVSETKEITTLGRGGSDTSAVALAVALKASVCEIFTDVDGVFSADPRIVSAAKFWKVIPSHLMLEMAARGAGVLHPRSVELAHQFRVSLKVRNSLNENEGTTVISDDVKVSAKGMEEFDITGVTADLSKVLIYVQLGRPTVLSALWNAAAGSHLSIIAPIFSENDVRFFSDRDGEGEWRKNLEDLSVAGFVKSYRIDLETIPLSIIGHRFSQDGTALAQIVDILAQNHITVNVGSSSSFAVTVGVPRDFMEEGVRALHSEFLEGRRA